MHLSVQKCDSRRTSLAILPGLLSLGILSMSQAPACAHEFKAGTLTIEHPWSRATAPGAKTAAGYTVIDNVGDAPDRLLSATFEAAEKASPHIMTMDGDVMKMRALPEGIVIPAKGSVALKPGSFHLMFEGLKHPLKQGESVPGTLTFEKAGTVPISFKVEAIGTTDPHTGMKGMKMD
jgi:hypothetical protein